MADSKGGKTLSLKEELSKRSRSKLLKRIRIPVAILLVAAVAGSILFALGDTRRSNIADSFRAIPITFGGSPGYPYGEDDLSLSKVMLVGDKPLLVTDSGVRVLSQNADELQFIPIDRSNTKAYSFNGRALLYSNTSDKAYLISRTKVLNTFEEDGTVITAAVGKDGSCALSCTGDRVQSVVNVYSPEGSLRFRWDCSRDYVSSLSLSGNGRKVFISAISSENARLFSRLILFKTSGSESEFEVALKGTTVLKTVASSSHYVAVGDNKTVILSSKGETLYETEYPADSLYAAFGDSKGNCLVCYKQFGGSKLSFIYIPAHSKTPSEFTLDYLPACLDMRGRRIAAALDNTVKVLSPHGDVKEEYECDNKVGTVLLQSEGIFTLENGSVCKY